MNFLKNTRNLFGLFNIILAIYFLVVSILYFLSFFSIVNGVLLVYIGLVFLSVGIGTIIKNLKSTLYIISYLTIVLIMSILSLWIISTTNFNDLIITVVACALGVVVMIVNEVVIEKYINYKDKKKLH